MKLQALVLLVAFGAATASAQISVTYTPESMQLTRKLGGQIVEMGAWAVRVCNDGPGQRVVDAERIYSAAPIPFVGPHRARLLLSTKQREKRGVVAAELLSVGAMALTGAIAANWINVNEGWIGGSAALAGPMLGQIADGLRKSEDESRLDPEVVLLEPLVLDAGRCVERQGWTNILRRELVHQYQAVIR